MNTREKIIFESLNLFSKRGFDAISVRDIAKAVGIKASSLYNHFKNKQDIFDTIVKKYSERVNIFFEHMAIEDYSNITIFNQASDIPNDNFFKRSIYIFNFYLYDEYTVKFRKLLTIEQFNNSKLADLYNQIFIDDVLNIQTEIFKSFIDENILIKKDPYILALQFYSPVFLLFNKFENITDKERISLRKHISQFKEIYTMKG